MRPSRQPRQIFRQRSTSTRSLWIPIPRPPAQPLPPFGGHLCTTIFSAISADIPLTTLLPPRRDLSPLLTLPSKRSTTCPPTTGKLVNECPLSPVAKNNPGYPGCSQNNHSASSVSTRNHIHLSILTLALVYHSLACPSCFMLTCTPTTIRLDKLPLPKLGQHHFHDPPQPLPPFIRYLIRRMIRMRSRDRHMHDLLVG
jgi:hypothetical protein